jgi:endonuclease YncB( thermonuclease family)
VRDRDRYGRIITTCVAQDSDVAREMVRQGWAVAYTRFSIAYVIEEIAARAAHRPLWAGEFDSPEGSASVTNATDAPNVISSVPCCTLHRAQHQQQASRLYRELK